MCAERMTELNSVELCFETFGGSGDPAVLLISGGPAGMLTWDDGLCAELAAGGRFVIRYDGRDTGRSTTYPTGAPEYDLRVLAADAAGLLDSLGIGRAQVVGFSVGGWVAQLLALDYPERVESLVLMSTRPVAHGVRDPNLPDHTPEVMAFFAGAGQPDWSDPTAVVDHLVASERAFAGSRPYDEGARRRVLENVVRRGANLASSLLNISCTHPGPRWRERLGEIDVPVLVVHGDEDPFFPVGNAVALAEEIPGARLLTLPGVGHEPTDLTTVFGKA
jgi:pimeloyl-ACP methyl ester carboxylesterase